MRLRPLQLWSLDITHAQADATLLESSTLVDDVDSVPSIQIYNLSDDRLYRQGKLIGRCVAIDSEARQREAVALAGSVEWLLLRCSGDMTMIPVENLISVCWPSGTNLAVFADNVEDINGLAFSLQHGVDALILGQVEGIWAVAIAARDQRARLSLAAAGEGSLIPREDKSVVVGRVTQVCSSGVGDRVCIDFVQLLHPGEGVWVGSCARALALVHGEVFDSEFVPSRPFRVNCGAVHSYVLMADGNLRYLAELRAGDAVKVFNMATTSSRDVVVGRVKIEPRPLMKVSFSTEEGSGNVFLQQAETVRIICSMKDSSGWEAVPITSLPTEVEVYLRLQGRGTHLGKAIDADVLEI